MIAHITGILERKSRNRAVVDVGGIDSDGQITVVDAIIALQMAVRGEYDDAADMNRGGRVTALDALTILQAAADRIEIG